LRTFEAVDPETVEGAADGAAGFAAGAAGFALGPPGFATGATGFAMGAAGFAVLSFPIIKSSAARLTVTRANKATATSDDLSTTNFSRR
jgi:hypothetical protein